MNMLYKKLFNCVYWMSIFIFAGCQYSITDFDGFDGVISGRVVDESGNIVPGDITSTTLLVKTLGEGDETSIDMRVNGKGVFQNTKLFTKKYRIWITGPVTPIDDDTLRVDLSANKNLVHDFVVVPFITIKKPLVENPTSTSVSVNYEMNANGEKEISKRELYCSTNPYPNASTGSGPFYHTIRTTLNGDSNNIIITGLTANTKYFLRVGALALGANGMNYSEQIIFETLSK